MTRKQKSFIRKCDTEITALQNEIDHIKLIMNMDDKVRDDAVKACEDLIKSLTVIKQSIINQQEG